MLFNQSQQHVAQYNVFDVLKKIILSQNIGHSPLHEILMNFFSYSSLVFSPILTRRERKRIEGMLVILIYFLLQSKWI